MFLDRWTRRYWKPDGGGGGSAGEGGGAGGANGGGAGGGEGSGGGSGGGGGEGGGGAPPHWSTALPEDLRGHEFVKGSKDLADFTTQSINAQGLLGRKGVIVPKDDAKPEDWDKFYSDLGRPKAPTDYKVPERSDKQAYTDADKAFQGVMMPALHKAGLSQKQVDAVTGAYNDHVIQLEGAFKAFADKSSEALDKEWGADRQAKIDAGSRFARAALPGNDYENLKRLPLVGGGFVADHPLVLKLLAKAGEAMGDDGGPGGGSGGAGDPLSSPEAAKAYVDGVYAAAETDKKHWLNDPQSAEHKKNKEYLHRVQRLANRRQAQD